MPSEGLAVPFRKGVVEASPCSWVSVIKAYTKRLALCASRQAHYTIKTLPFF